MTTRRAVIEEYEQVVDMFVTLINDVYPQRIKRERIFFYKSVLNWVNSGCDIMVAVADGGELAGFSLCYIKDEGIYDPYYYGDIAYVKPSFRNSKAAYLLYKSGSDMAQELHLPLVAKAYIGNGGRNRVGQIQEKFGMKPQFVEYERGV